jgi:tripartite-type tricarboxylate transporter receptor subunit TctC
MENFFGVVAPAKTPKDTLAQLASWFTAAMEAPESRTKLAAQFLYTENLCGDRYGEMLRKSHDRYGEAIRAANIKVQ